jgi:hypothetical protein
MAARVMAINAVLLLDAGQEGRPVSFWPQPNSLVVVRRPVVRKSQQATCSDAR